MIIKQMITNILLSSLRTFLWEQILEQKMSSIPHEDTVRKNGQLQLMKRSDPKTESKVQFLTAKMNNPNTRADFQLTEP
jgi:hypothetical protein